MRKVLFAAGAALLATQSAAQPPHAPKLLVVIAGHTIDQRWYWTGAKFETDNKSARVPQVVGKVNALAAAGLATDRPALDATTYCQTKARELPIQGGGKPVGAGRLARKAGDQ